MIRLNPDFRSRPSRRFRPMDPNTSRAFYWLAWDAAGRNVGIVYSDDPERRSVTKGDARRALDLLGFEGGDVSPLRLAHDDAERNRTFPFSMPDL
jgi:hypothetical protein